MELTFCTDICCQITLNLKFIIVLVTICMNLISWQTAITDIYKHPVLYLKVQFVKMFLLLRFIFTFSWRLGLRAGLNIVIILLANEGKLRHSNPAIRHE
jgi:hypothetical protein